MRLPSDVPKLQEDASAAGVDGLNDRAPRRDLLECEDARRAHIAKAARRDHGRFRDDEAAFGGALRIVRGGETARNAVQSSPHPRQGRHHHAVTEAVGSDGARIEQHWHGEIQVLCRTETSP